MSYLLDVEKRYGSMGMFSDSGDGPYNRYHATYCAIVGLLSYSFGPTSGTCEGEMVPLIPRAFGEPKKNLSSVPV